MWVADFETTTSELDCRVWAWAVCEIGYPENIYYGNSIESYFDICMKSGSMVHYFHNLKFDGSFILYYLLTHGFRETQNSKKIKNGEFNALISDKGQFYTIRIRFFNGVKLELRDSFKLLTFSVGQIAMAFNLKYQKLELDYTAYRGIGHELTEEEKAYIHNDVAIMSLALSEIFKMGFSKLTQGSNALEDYKNIIGKNRFRKLFPVCSYDAEIRKSYKGGFTYLNPIYADKDIGKGNVLDVNSLYPSRMYFCELPYGEGKYFYGEYVFDKDYPLYIINLRCEFKLKKGKLPIIQLKNDFRFMPTEYIESSGDDAIDLCLTNVDYELFKEHYNLYNVEYYGGWKFKQSNKLFREYIDKWMKIKVNASKEGNKTMRTWAKIMLNSLYGKFALNPICARKSPYIGKDKRLHFKTLEKEEREPLYLPVGAFITAYARRFTIETSQMVRDYSLKKYGKDMYIYSDTDSIHTLLPYDDIIKIIDVDDNELGKWKHESEFTRARFIRAKTYIEEIEGKICITCAGLPERCYKEVTWENFHPGVTYYGKLLPKQEIGGIVLHETEFHIHET